MDKGRSAVEPLDNKCLGCRPGMRLYLATAGCLLCGMRAPAHREATKMLIEILLWALLIIGVFAAVWELEQIRKHLDKQL